MAVLNGWVSSGGLLMTGNIANGAGPGGPGGGGVGEALADQLQAEVEGYHPELRGQVVDRLAHHRSHFAPLFAPGHLRSLVALRPELRPAAVDVAGDYLRSPCLEGALAASTEAADRVHTRLISAS